MNKYLVTILLMVLTAAVPTGTLTAQAEGLNHGTQSAPLVPSEYVATVPSIQLFGNGDSPKKVFTVDGTGFEASVQVNLYFKSKLVTNTTTNPSGDFSVDMTVPVYPEGTYTVLAKQANGHAQAQAPFNIVPGFSHLQPKTGSDVAPVDPLCKQIGLPPPPGQPLKLGVWGEPANVAYEIKWKDAVTGGYEVQVASGTTASNGTLTTSFDVPQAPGGFYKLIVNIPSLGQNNPDALYYSDTYTCFTYGEGQGNLDWNWDGVSWDANSVVTLTVNGTQIQQTATTNAQGSFSTGFQVPCPPPGTYPGAITGTTNGGQAVSIPLNPPITVDNNCLCLPRCAPGGSSTINSGALEARP